KREEVISADKNLKDSIQFYRYLQFVFFEQWNDLKSYSKTKGRKIIGDIPFYVGYDSSDVWANSKAFQFDKEGKPSFVSGVPPDYFSATGQLWGSPVYEWEEEQCFEWWLKSLQHLLRVADMIRIDHFRAVDSFWKIPYKVALSEKTAVKGVWSKGPGKELFRRIKEYLVQSKLLEENSQLPFIAEDLGFLDPLYATVKSYPESFSKDKKFKVDKKFREMIRSKHLGLGLALDHVTGEYSTRKGVGLVLEEFSIPYMLVLQFGMSGDFRSRPENVPSNCVYYSGTHDNDTIKGWYDSSDKSTIDNYLSNSEEFQKTKSLINGVLEMLYSSNACLAGVPFQDLLDLGSEARMNLPSNMKEGGWWTWRATKSQLDYSKIANLLSNLAKKYRRFC
ncbi:hypothetical protein FJZ53_06000, partial [Candidatus Woesearchaeota archaeon]|nr:hypothetical protein [Candidatus Woesearchaeota archaeon]